MFSNIYTHIHSMGKERIFVWAKLSFKVSTGWFKILKKKKDDSRGQPSHPSFLVSSSYTFLVFIHSSLLGHESWHIYSHAHLTHINKRFVAVFKCSISLHQQQGCEGLVGHPSGILLPHFPFSWSEGEEEEKNIYTFKWVECLLLG